MPPRNAFRFKAVSVFLITSLASFCLAASCAAASLLKSFRKLRQQSASLEAFERAVERLADTRVGMTQREFFDVMRLQLLMLHDRPMAACVEGYLGSGPASLTGDERHTEGRRMLFGYREGERDVPRVLVIFREDRLSEVRDLVEPGPPASYRDTPAADACSFCSGTSKRPHSREAPSLLDGDQEVYQCPR